ncbi:metallo-beta-lactamase domain protein [Leptospira licerasiae serovar Varillal str. VAR 010]|uniref:Metallo-beta-lactamase domain protein n=1 Tax=Leptospira licerasiae str. MMD4847 TaxID=1049971 RepID=A0ABP2RJ39_9LEPT|nr:metallo-beta-lactamase domain protein [Leptospira licerasiae serovar Varillal str. VAR 010]EJZ43608.1 metallo-beta-lactamase domain protein [Leptospira licerasiae str. MMD4847]
MKIFILLASVLLLCCGTYSSPKIKNPSPKIQGSLSSTELQDGLYAILVGTSFYQNRLTNSDKQDGESEITFLFYLIKSDKRYILIDTGTSTNSTTEFTIYNWISPDKILRSVGIQPGMIGEIILTHFHSDHSGGIGLFPNAKIYVTQEDWNSLKKTNRSISQKLSAKERSGKIQFLTSSIEVFKNFRILLTRGHTQGSMAVEWLISQSKKFLITGDECYWIEYCEQGHGLPSESTFSLSNNKEFLDYVSVLSSNGTKILTMHDPAILSLGKEIFPRIYKLD